MILLMWSMIIKEDYPTQILQSLTSLVRCVCVCVCVCGTYTCTCTCVLLSLSSHPFSSSSLSSSLNSPYVSVHRYRRSHPKKSCQSTAVGRSRVRAKASLVRKHSISSSYKEEAETEIHGLPLGTKPDV